MEFRKMVTIIRCTRQDLHPAAFEIHAQGDQRITVLLDFTQKAHNFPPMHQKPARPAGVYIEAVSVIVGRDVHLVQDQLAVFNAEPGVLQVQGALADGLNLCANQLDAGLHLFDHKILVIGLPVPGHHLDAFLFQILTSLSSVVSLYHNCQGLILFA